MLHLVLQDQPHRPLSDLWGVLRLSCHDPILSNAEASDNPPPGGGGICSYRLEPVCATVGQDQRQRLCQPIESPSSIVDSEFVIGSNLN